VSFRLCKIGICADDEDWFSRYSIGVMSIQRVALGRLSRSGTVTERCAPMLLVYMLVRAGCAYAEEPPVPTHGSVREPPARSPAPRLARPVAELPLQDLSAKFELPSDYSPHEYRALGPAPAGRESGAADLDGSPVALRASTAWDRLADYKTRGGIRLLTIWKSKFSSLSLQTGHGGRPSLQWSSRGFGGAPGATHGVLDRILASGIDRFEVFRHGLRVENPAGADRPADRHEN